MAITVFGLVKAMHKGPSAPSNTDIVWRDTSGSPHVTKVYDNVGGQWEAIKNFNQFSVDEANPAGNSAGVDEFATGILLGTTPTAGLLAFRNGINYPIGDGVKTKPFYFSPDGGTTARALNTIVQGDELIYNPVQTGGVGNPVDIKTTDVIYIYQV